MQSKNDEKSRPRSLDLKKNKQTDKKSQNFHDITDDELQLSLLGGTVIKDGDMVLFVAENLEHQIKLASPAGKRDNKINELKNFKSHFHKKKVNSNISLLDHNFLNELENEAKRITTSLDSLSENLAGILHSASALTVNCLEIHRDSVSKASDNIDYNIKSMYQLMAKCEEVSKSMTILYQSSEKMRQIKKLLDLLECTLIS